MSAEMEKLLDERVKRYYGPLQLMIWQGFLFLLVVVLQDSCRQLAENWLSF